ncbi:nucleoside ABC transporter ATP-binding protein [Tissierella praeacuta DSM 18095]|uniref:Nucleoside ABC transporter ATP-binding protein n=1 Tax=Tissierella praeacuta DSM 18095 TaxID=1123404 RepID=A0A1M4UK77_9FIRM|nr:ABC transporter ATP-binding protein [Tissierella praeacuta]SHE57099.1 nucleoside ABC transporter ATP-binding protein [Tissierella praeacuta DSM 18095]SUP03630.1 Galactose/methyl galactoside import ATP-binding protein MglA [Tissierella praeacuta]
MDDKVLELKNISKQFPGVLANDNINLEIKRGEIHAIVGENGAGKSTLMNILYGLYEPTIGEIYFNSKAVKFMSPLDAIELGIGMVHQHFMLVPSFTVAENIVLGTEPRKNKMFVNKEKAIEVTKELSNTYGLIVDPMLKVESLSVGIQQRVEILKALYKGADILILDEPTAVLTPQETEELFKVIRKLVNELGKTIIIITHKLQEVLSISDRVSVMRQGKMIGTLNTKDANEQILAEMMVGREVLFHKLDKRNTENKEVLRVEKLSAKNNRGLLAIKDISFNLKSGEILGIAGIEGNGQSELVEVLTGLREKESGEFFIKEIESSNKSPRDIRKLGIAHVPEDRLAMGLSKDATISENIIMGSQYKKPYAIKGLQLNKSKIREKSKELINRFDIRTPSEEVFAGNLSGGNMQKMIIAREFTFDTPILIISQPTRGVDIGAIEFIHKEIIKKRNEGCAILLVSAELDEIFRLSDRIMTIYEGSITGEFDEGTISKQEIGLYMTGKNMSLEEGV